MPRKGYKQTPEAIANRVASHIGWRKPNKKGWVHNGRRVIQDGTREIFEHRYIMEQHLGRPLEPNEVVHHKNEDRMDNRLENLELMTRSQHIAHHNTGKSRKGQPHAPWTDEQRVVYLKALKKRRRPTPEECARRSEYMKQYRATHFWSSKPHNTCS